MGARELVVHAAPEEVVYRAALALRRLGARIVRYDARQATLEARAGRRLLPQVVRVHARPEGDDATRVVIDTDRTDWRALVPQLAAELEAAEWR